MTKLSISAALRRTALATCVDCDWDPRPCGADMINMRLGRRFGSRIVSPYPRPKLPWLSVMMDPSRVFFDSFSSKNAAPGFLSSQPRSARHRRQSRAGEVSPNRIRDAERFPRSCACLPPDLREHRRDKRPLDGTSVLSPSTSGPLPPLLGSVEGAESPPDWLGHVGLGFHLVEVVPIVDDGEGIEGDRPQRYPPGEIGRRYRSDGTGEVLRSTEG
jgi:hypothetical protein